MKDKEKKVVVVDPDPDQEYMCPSCHGRFYGDELDDGECPQCETEKPLYRVRRK